MTKSEDEYINRKVVVSAAGAKLGAIIGDALTKLSATMAAETDLRAVADARSDADALRATTFDFDVSARVHAIAQILVHLVDEMVAEHARSGSDCLDACMDAMLTSCLSDAAQLAEEQSKHNHAARARGKVAEALLDDTDPAGSAVAEAAKRKLDELLASLRKGG